MANQFLRIGFPGMVAEIPAPLTGMGFGNTGDNEITELASGGRHVHNAPTTFKSFSMSWRDKTRNLQPIIDLYNRRYGNQFLFMQDPNNAQGNMFPPRWAYSYQLAHLMAGQGQPFISTAGGVYPAVVLNDKAWGLFPPALTIMLVPGKSHLLKVWGTRTGTAGVRWRLHNATTRVWGAWTTHVPTETNSAPQTVATELTSSTHDFVEFQVVVPAGGTLSLNGMDFGVSDYRSYPDRRPGEGVGALRFTNALDGELTSARLERVGLSVELTEVESLRGW